MDMLCVCIYSESAVILKMNLATDFLIYPVKRSWRLSCPNYYTEERGF